jgi:hypothetical protein
MKKSRRDRDGAVENRAAPPGFAAAADAATRQAMMTGALTHSMSDVEVLVML